MDSQMWINDMYLDVISWVSQESELLKSETYLFFQYLYSLLSFFLNFNLQIQTVYFWNNNFSKQLIWIAMQSL